MKNILLGVLLLTGICFSTCKVEKDVEIVQEEIAPGVIKLTKGEVEHLANVVYVNVQL